MDILNWRLNSFCINCVIVRNLETNLWFPGPIYLTKQIYYVLIIFGYLGTPSPWRNEKILNFRWIIHFFVRLCQKSIKCSSSDSSVTPVTRVPRLLRDPSFGKFVPDFCGLYFEYSWIPLTIHWGENSTMWWHMVSGATEKLIINLKHTTSTWKLHNRCICEINKKIAPIYFRAAPNDLFFAPTNFRVPLREN